jgi:hypothetical protein
MRVKMALNFVWVSVYEPSVGIVKPSVIADIVAKFFRQDAGGLITAHPVILRQPLD